MVSSSYLSDYRIHLADTRAHLFGTSTIDNDSNDDDDDDDIESSFDTFLHWSSEEKGRLFHALSVHSRWRLDLVAACVHTKSIVDVSLAINDLMQAAASLDSEPSTCEARRRALPRAMTMSDKWVAQEDKEAQELALVEPLWETAAILQARQAQKGVTALEAEETSQEMRWAREDAFARLDDKQLRVIGMLVREAEEVAEKGSGRKRKRGEEEEEEDLGDGEENLDTETNTPDLMTLSPLSRRRYQKRLYMRRKRAELTGAAVEEGLARLKPGRPFRPRTKRKAKHKRGGSENEPESEDGEGGGDIVRSEAEDDETRSVDEHSTEDSDNRHPNVGGLTAPYRIKSEFAKMGVKGNTLRREGFGLLHLGGIAKAMKSISKNTLSINASTIRLLDAAITGYIKELVGRVIVLRAEEVRQKGGSKAWHNKSSCEVRARDVREVVEEWETEKYGSVKVEIGEEDKGEEEEDEDVDSEAEMGELDDEESVELEDGGEEDRYERSLWIRLAS